MHRDFLITLYIISYIFQPLNIALPGTNTSAAETVSKNVTTDTKRTLLQNPFQYRTLDFRFTPDIPDSPQGLSVFRDSCISARGPGSSVGIATGYGLDGPEIESRWEGEIFRTCPDRSWGPPSPLYNGYRVFPGGKERPGRDADPSPPSSAVVMKG